MGLFSSRFPLKRVLFLCKQLGSMEVAGIPPAKALSILIEQQRRGAFKRSLQHVLDDVVRGVSLGKAFRGQSHRFPSFFVEFLAVGEQSGKYAEAMHNLAAYYEERLEARRRFLSQLAYPIILVLCAFLIFPYLKGAAICFYTGRDVGAFTLRFILGLVRAWAPILIALVILARMGLLRRMWSPIGYRVWPFADLTLLFSLAKFFRCLSMLLDSGFLMTKAVERSAALVDNLTLRKELMKVVPAVLRGETLEEAFSKMDRLPFEAYTMIVTGEKNGRLAAHLEDVARWFYDAANHKLKVIARALGPIAVVLIALQYFIGIQNLIKMIIYAIGDIIW